MAGQINSRSGKKAPRWAGALSTLASVLAVARGAEIGVRGHDRPLRPSVRSAVAGARRVAVLLSVVTLLSGSVQAQETPLVSNHAQDAPAGTQIVNALEFAQGFISGSSPGGHLLNGIYIHFDRTPGILSNFVATLWSADLSGSRPGAWLYVLSNPGDLSTNEPRMFAAPPGTVLQPGTTYFVHLSYDWAGNERTPVVRTATGDQADSEALKDWSVADNWFSRERGSSEPWNAYTEAIKITVDGSVVAPPAPSAADGGGAWSVTVTPATITEAVADPAMFTVSTGTSFTVDQTIALALAGTAKAGEDYTVASGGTALSAPHRVTLPAGTTSVTAAFHPVADTVADSGETIRITAIHDGVQIGERRTVTITDTRLAKGVLGRPLVVAGGAAAALAAGVAALAGGGDDGSSGAATSTQEDGVAVLTVSPRRVAEGSGATTATVTAFLTTGTRDIPTEVTVRVGGGTATSGRDYRPVGRLTLTIPAGARQGQETFTLTPVQDEIAEGPETLVVNGTVTGLTVRGAIQTIADDDARGVRVEPTELAVMEGGTGTYTVSLTSQPQRNVTVVMGGVTSDVVVSPQELTFTALNWNQGLTVTVTAVNDGVGEGEERVELTHAVSGYGPITATHGVTVKIADLDDVSTRIDLSLNQISVSEGDDAILATVAASLDAGPRGEATQVTIAVAGGTAIAGTDYRTVSTVILTIPSGARNGTATFTLQPLQDTIVEGVETLQVSGTVTAGGALPVNAATLTLEDDDTASTRIDLSLSPSRVPEGGGDTSVTVTAALDAEPRREATQVTVTVAGGTATVGTDYRAVSTVMLTIPAGARNGTATFALQPLQDTIVEGVEALHVSGAVTAGGALPVTAATLTLDDDDTASTRIDLSVHPIRIWEGAKATLVTVTAALDAGSLEQDTYLRVSVAGGTATARTDYEADRSLLLKIPAGALKGTKTFTLTPVDDTLDENNETVYVTGTVTRASQLRVTGDTLWLIDNDAAPASAIGGGRDSSGMPPVLTIRPGRAVEGAGQVEFRVEPSTVSRLPVTVSYNTEEGTATEGEDYTPKSGMLTFAPGTVTEQKILVEINDDLLDEDDEETFTMTLRDARNAVLPQGAMQQKATGTIEDDDTSSTGISLSLNPTSVSEADGSTTVTVTATLNGAAQMAATQVTVSVAGNTAAAGTDFRAVTDVMLTIPPEDLNGETTFTFVPLQDTIPEEAETVTVSGAVTTGTALPVTAATLTLHDDDSTSTRIELSLNPTSVSEDDSATTVTVKATLDSMALTADTQVTVSVGGGTAESGTDYSPVPTLTVTILEGDLSGTADFTLTPAQDEIAEGPETLEVSGTVTMGSTLPVTTATLTLTDDDTASTSIALSLVPDSVSEDAAAIRVTVTATLNDGARTEETQVTVSVGDVTALAGKDFEATNDVTLTIAPGAKSGTVDFTLTPMQDDIYEGPETLEVSGTVTAGTTLPVNAVTLTLTDDDAASTTIVLSLDPDSVSEEAAATPVTVTATLDAASRTEETEVTVSVGGGTAVSGTDYAPVPAVTVTIAAGAKSGAADFTLTPTQDEIDEPSETLAFGGTVVTTGTDLTVTEATLTLTDDDTASTNIALSLVPDSVSEDAAETTVTVEATLNDGARTEETQVTVSVGDGTALAGKDFEAINDVTLTIAPGAKTGTVDFTLTPMQDNIYEGPETLEVSGTARNLMVTPATLTLTDDDTESTAIALSLDPDSVFEAAADPVGVTVTATLNEGTRTADTQVTVSVAGDTATAGTDFTEVENVTLTILAGKVSGTAIFMLEPLQDEIAEDAETLEVSGTAGILTVTPATLTLNDDDKASTSIALSLSPNRVSEAAGDTPVAVTATLNEGARDSDTEVTVTVSGGTATAATDYAEVDDMTVTIPAGKLSGEEVFALSPTQDDLAEPSETLVFSGMADLTVTDATLTLTDVEDTRWSVVADPDSIEEDGGTSTLTLSTNDTTFPDDQTITLYLTGSTATPGVDFRLADAGGTTLNSPYLLTLKAGDTSVTATITALDDVLTEAGERIAISALHSHTAIGTEWVTIADDETTSRAFGVEPKSCNERPLPEQVQINGRKVTMVFNQDLGTGTQDPNDIPYPPYFHFEIHTDSNPDPPDPNPEKPRFVGDDNVEPGQDHYAVAYSRQGRRVELTTEAPVTAGETVWVVYHRFGVYAPLFDVGNENGVCLFVTRAENLTLGFITVANVEASEDDGAINFEVILTPAASQASGTVTVDYDTVNGTAMAGEDYVATSGKLSFDPGESSHTVSVTLLDDSLEDGGETFTLTLRNASTEKGYWITNGEAIGTIYNTDPLPKAWTARFGRTVASHVVDALEARLDASQTYAQIGGHRLGGIADARTMGWRLAPDRKLWQEGAAEAVGQGMTTHQLLLGSSFHLVSNDGEGAIGPRLTAWGRVAASSFEGKEDGLSLSGTVTTATLGVDGAWKRWLTGVALAYSEGEGSFSQDQDVGSTLTSLHPYVAYAVSDRVRLWGMVGYGDGEFRLSGPQALSTGLEMTMGALGVRGTLLEPSQPDGGLQLALRSDVMWVGTDTAASTGMAATEAEVSRLRMALEGSRPIPLAQGGSLVPSLEIGFRHDGGDAETGLGVEAGGGLLYDTAWGLSIEASVRGLLAHEASDYREWGASGALRFAPGRQGRELTASIMPAWGSAASGVSRLWGQAEASRLAAANAPATAAAGRLDAELGYGLTAPWGRGLLTPYARVALVEGAEQAWHLGTRLALFESLNLSLQAGRRQREGQVAAHELALRAYLGW